MKAVLAGLVVRAAASRGTVTAHRSRRRVHRFPARGRHDRVGG